MIVRRRCCCGDDDLYSEMEYTHVPRHHSHIRYTCQHVHFGPAISCNGASNRDLRDDRAPRTGRFTGNHAYACAGLAEHATPNVETRQIRSRNRTNGTAQDRFQCSVTAIARRGPESRRCHAQTRALMMLSTTAGSTAIVCIMPAPWSRSCTPPTTCSHLELPEASKHAPTGEIR